MILKLEIVTDYPNLIEFVDNRQKENSHQLGFIRLTNLQEAYEKGRIFLALLKRKPVGYVFVGSNRRPRVRCFQLYVDEAARGQGIGRSLALVIEEYALNGSATAVQLRCAYDLEANKFWKAMGYKCISIIPGGESKKRTINVWKKQLQNELFSDFNLDPARNR